MKATITGRILRRELPMQNIPIRTTEGRRIREAFPRPELDFDYGSLERDMMAQMGLSKCSGCGALTDGDPCNNCGTPR